MVGFRVFDVGLLVAWLIWFFRLRDDGEDPPGEDGGGGEGPRSRSGPRRTGRRRHQAPARALAARPRARPRVTPVLADPGRRRGGELSCPGRFRRA